MLPKFYCINLKTSTARKERMLARFNDAKIPDGGVHFVEAIRPGTGIVTYYCQKNPLTTQERLNGACSASHLKAIRTFLESDEDEAFICEDDICLKKNFIEEWNNVKSNLPTNAPLLTCSYMLTSHDGKILSGKNPTLNNIYLLCPINTWGAQLYWLNRDYAIKALEMFDKPMINPQFNEQIIRLSKGYLCTPPLAIEDCLDSDRAPRDLPYHFVHFDSWHRHNYQDKIPILLKK